MPQKITIALIISAILAGSAIIAGAIIFSGKNSQNGGSAPTNSPSPSATPVSKYGAAVLENFAKCLTEKGLKFYGAWWCPHCQNQKAMFGDAFQYVDYIECEKNPGTSRGQQVDACLEADITGYPTWILSDGSREKGEIPLENLAEISNCPLE